MTANANANPLPTANAEKAATAKGLKREPTANAARINPLSTASAAGAAIAKELKRGPIASAKKAATPKKPPAHVERIVHTERTAAAAPTANAANSPI